MGVVVQDTIQFASLEPDASWVGAPVCWSLVGYRDRMTWDRGDSERPKGWAWPLCGRLRVALAKMLAIAQVEYCLGDTRKQVS